MVTLQKLVAYNIWANDILLTYLEKLTEVPEKCIVLMSHIFNAQVIWLQRLEGKTSAITPFYLNTLEQCRHIHNTTNLQLISMSQKDEASLEHIIKYVTTTGDSFESATIDILIQVLNHGTYHRGQIAQLLRINGLEPVNTDYITYVRCNINPTLK